MDQPVVRKTAKRRLTLERETVRNLNDPILTTQGWSLWTCDETGDVRYAPAPPDPRGASADD